MTTYKQVTNNQMLFTRDEKKDLIKQNVKILVTNNTKNTLNKQSISNDFLQSFVSSVPTATCSSPNREERSFSSNSINIKKSNSKLAVSKIKFNSPTNNKRELPLKIKESINRIYYEELEKRQMNLETLTLKYYPNIIRKNTFKINSPMRISNATTENSHISLFENRRKLHKFLDTEYYLSKIKNN